MKKKNNKQFYIERAISDMRSLVIYFNVTRPQYEHNYHHDGKFSLEKLQNQFEFLSGWNKRSAGEKRVLAKLYAAYSKTFNLTFGIPNSLVKKVLGCYRDENGKQIRISIDEVVPKLVAEGFITEVNAGRKVDYKTHEVKCFWTKKYLLKNVKYWFKLFNDKRYHDVSTFPYASSRIKEIIFEFVKSFSTKTEEPKPETNETQNVPSSNVAVDVRKFPDYDKFIKYFKSGIINIDTTEEELMSLKWNDFSTVKVMMDMVRNHKNERN